MQEKQEQTINPSPSLLGVWFAYTTLSLIIFTFMAFIAWLWPHILNLIAWACGFLDIAPILAWAILCALMGALMGALFEGRR